LWAPCETLKANLKKHAGKQRCCPRALRQLPLLKREALPPIGSKEKLCPPLAQKRSFAPHRFKREALPPISSKEKLCPPSALCSPSAPGAHGLKAADASARRPKIDFYRSHVHRVGLVCERNFEEAHAGAVEEQRLLVAQVDDSPDVRREPILARGSNSSAGGARAADTAAGTSPACWNCCSTFERGWGAARAAGPPAQHRSHTHSSHTAVTHAGRYHGGALEEGDNRRLVPHAAVVAEAKHMRLRKQKSIRRRVEGGGYRVKGGGGGEPAGGEGRVGLARGAAAPAAQRATPPSPRTEECRAPHRPAGWRRRTKSRILRKPPLQMPPRPAENPEMCVERGQRPRRRRQASAAPQNP
jgi:hypothetical protein